MQSQPSSLLLLFFFFFFFFLALFDHFKLFLSFYDFLLS